MKTASHLSFGPFQCFRFYDWWYTSAQTKNTREKQYKNTQAQPKNPFARRAMPHVVRKHIRWVPENVRVCVCVRRIVRAPRSILIEFWPVNWTYLNMPWNVHNASAVCRCPYAEHGLVRVLFSGKSYSANYCVTWFVHFWWYHSTSTVVLGLCACGVAHTLLWYAPKMFKLPPAVRSKARKWVILLEPKPQPMLRANW